MPPEQDNDVMSTVEKPAAVDLQELADHEAAEQHYVEGTPFEPELARRIQERAEKIRQKLAPIDVDRLIHETRDER
jgi:type II secretory pathway component PulM